MRFLPALIAVASAAVREFHWTVTQFNSNYDGVVRPVLGINNQPGHMNKIEVNSGDIVRVYVTNGLLGVGTALHWHGMHQRGTQSSDGAAGITQVCSHCNSSAKFHPGGRIFINLVQPAKLGRTGGILTLKDSMLMVCVVLLLFANQTAPILLQMT